MREETIKIYLYDELPTEEAKERARDWFREGNLYYDWYAYVFEDAKQVASLMGIEIKDIFFSGFWSQGDGACFTGHYSYAKGGAKAVKAYAPKDEELHRIAQELQAIQRKNCYQLTADVTHRGRYNHEYSNYISVDMYDYNANFYTSDAEEMVKELLRDFMQWIYKQLEIEYEYLNSDESVIESIRANEYEFTEAGEVA